MTAEGAAAAAVGMSVEELRCARAVVEAAEPDQDKFGDLVEQMDASNDVFTAHAELVRRRGEALSALPAQIDSAIADVKTHAVGMVTAAVRAGELLLQAKAGVPHGEWEPWLTSHCTVAPRTARAYMQLAKRYSELPDQERQSIAVLPLHEALKAITTAPAAPPSPPRYRLPLTKANAVREALRAVERRVGSLARDAGIKSIKPERIKSTREVLLAAVAALDAMLSEVPTSDN